MKFKGCHFVFIPGDGKLTIRVPHSSKCSDKFSCMWLFALFTQDIQQVFLLFYYFMNRMAEYSAITSVFNLSSKLLCCGEILQRSPQESTGFDCKWPECDLHAPSKQKVGNWKIAFNIFSSVI